MNSNIRSKVEWRKCEERVDETMNTRYIKSEIYFICFSLIFLMGDLLVCAGASASFKTQTLCTQHSIKVYAEKSCKTKQADIEAFSKITVIGKAKSSYQISYQVKSRDETGWIRQSSYEDCLEFDGRDKKILSNGTYTFQAGYIDSVEDDVEIEDEEQTELEKYEPYHLKIQYEADGKYFIQNRDTKKYLSVRRISTLPEEDTSNQETVSYELCWLDEKEEEYGTFSFHRKVNSFSIQNTKTKLFVGQEEGTELKLSRQRRNLAFQWKIRARQKMLHKKNPMVFTQYDPEWGNRSYGTSGTIATSACALLTIVNSVYTLSGQYINVMELADYAVEKRYRVENRGTAETIFQAVGDVFGKKYGFSWDGEGTGFAEMREKLADGDVVVVHVQGHYMCIVDYDEEKNQYLMLDSSYAKKRGTTAFGDWIDASRLDSGTLGAQRFFYYCLDK